MPSRSCSAGWLLAPSGDNRIRKGRERPILHTETWAEKQGGLSQRRQVNQNSKEIAEQSKGGRTEGGTVFNKIRGRVWGFGMRGSGTAVRWQKPENSGGNVKRFSGLLISLWLIN